MPSRLIAYNPFPPGGFPYQQEQGIRHLFPDIGLNINQQAEKVLAFRVANKLDRATFPEVVQDIDYYTCVRLGGMGQYCVDSDKPYVSVNRGGGGGCSTCGQKL